MQQSLDHGDDPESKPDLSSESLTFDKSLSVKNLFSKPQTLQEHKEIIRELLKGTGLEHKPGYYERVTSPDFFAELGEVETVCMYIRYYLLSKKSGNDFGERGKIVAGLTYDIKNDVAQKFGVDSSSTKLVKEFHTTSELCQAAWTISCISSEIPMIDYDYSMTVTNITEKVIIAEGLKLEDVSKYIETVKYNHKLKIAGQDRQLDEFRGFIAKVEDDYSDFIPGSYAVVNPYLQVVIAVGFPNIAQARNWIVGFGGSENADNLMEALEIYQVSDYVYSVKDSA